MTAVDSPSIATDLEGSFLVSKELESFDYWYLWTCQNYSQTECKRLSAEEFKVKASIRQCGSFELSQAISVGDSTAHFERSADDIRKDARDHYEFMLILKGEVAMRQEDRAAVLGEGDMMIYHQGRPFSLSCKEGCDLIMINIPGPVLQSRLSESSRLTATRLGGESKFGALAGSVFRQLMTFDATDDEKALTRLSTSAMDILAASLEGGLTNSAELRTRHADILSKVKTYLLANLHDAEMSIETIARANNISERTLSRVFVAEATTPIRWLWQQRLAASYTALMEGNVRHVTDAAFNAGFNDMTHFSRSFKRTYGKSPNSLVRR
jgi:AraC-like DNA-binding protein/mannose-6-phosphate isomerase-like protein (cupin superfamily)